MSLEPPDAGPSPGPVDAAPQTGPRPDASPPPVTPTVSIGGACTSTAQCRNGGLCFNGICRQACMQDTQCGVGTGACCNSRITYQSVSTKVCNKPSVCDPFGPSKITDCATGYACYHFPCSTDRNNSDCTRPGTREVGAPCTFTNDCAPGNICLSNAGRCARLCRLDDDDCGNGPSCVQFGLAGTTYGYCPLE